MKLFTINDHMIRDIIGQLTIEDNVRKIIENIILKYDHSFTDFIYNIFSIYTSYYIQLLDENSYITHEEANKIFRDLASKNLDVDYNNVFVANIYDIIYGYVNYGEAKFKSDFYEDIYNRLEDLLGTENANTHMEEVFDAIETIFLVIENNLISNIIRCKEIDENIIFYFKPTPNKLIIYVI